MTRAIVFSVIIHLILFALLLSVPKPDQLKPVKDLRIRIASPLLRAVSNNREENSTFKPSAQLEKAGTRPSLPTVPAGEAAALKRGLIQSTIDDFSLLPLSSSPSQTSMKTSSRSVALPVLDPLDGMESHLPERSSKALSTELRGKWSISWENKHERGIVAIPVIDEGILMSSPERLNDVAVRITVSSQGFVIAAEIQQPGSGDVRIDRYLHGKALDFIFDKVLDEKGTDAGIFHLLFEESGIQ